MNIFCYPKRILYLFGKTPLSDNYVVYDNRITFKLGNSKDLDTKIMKGLAACDKLNSSSPNATGTMTVSTDKSIYFTEE